MDPLAEEFPAWNPYHYVHNNPINLIDPTGMSAVDGDYYDQQGNWLYNDGKNDKKVYEVSPMPGIAPGIEGSGANRIEYKGQVEDVFVTGDAPTDSKIQNLHPAIRMKATNFMKEANSESENTLIRIAQGLRTFDEQNDLYAKGRTAEGSIVTNAKGGYSNHNFGLAFDLVGITDGKVDYNLDWNSLSTMGKSHGFEWGGDWKSFKDQPHFQNMFGNSIQSLRNKYNSGSRVNGYVKF